MPLDELGFRVTQRIGGGGRIALQFGEFGFAFAQVRAQCFELILIAADVFVDFRQCLVGFRAIAIKPFAQLAVVLNLLFDARDFAADAIHLALNLVQVFAGRLMYFAMAFDLRFDLALFGDQTFDFGFAVTQCVGVFVEFARERSVMQRAQFRFALEMFGLQFLPARGGLGLAIQMFELFLDFLAHIVQAFEVFARRLDAAFSFLAAFLVFRNAGRFFEIAAQFVRMRGDDLRDHALLDDRIAARAETRAEKQVGDVAAAATRPVKEILRLPIAAGGAFDRDFVVLGVFADHGAVGVVEHEFDRRAADRFAAGRSGEDHIAQRIAAQAAGRAFAHHPADRVDDVGFAAAVRTDDAGHVGGQVQDSRIDEGFETGQLDRSQSHQYISRGG